MIVSALLTSVGINLALCVLFFAFYSILRKQPGNVKVYAPRLVAEGKAQESSGFNLENLLPTPGWVGAAWRISEDELLALAGLDGVVFMRIFVFSLKVFSVAAVIGIFILLPVNYLGDQLQDIDFSDLPNKSLNLFTISNVKDCSNRLWIHFSAAYLITGVVCYLLYFEYKFVYFKRLELFSTSKPQPHNFTVLVRGIPLHEGSSLNDIVERFFMEFHPLTYLSHIVVHRTSKLRSLIEVPAAFVCFKSRYGAAAAVHIQQSINPTQWVTEQAPEPRDVYWPFFSTSFMQQWISKLVVILASVVLIVVFLIPVTFVQGLTYLDQLETVFPFLNRILEITIVRQVITGYLPSLILHLFLSVVPSIMKLFSSMQGYIAYSEIEKSACIKMLWFTIWNIFFANVLTGSVASQVQVFLDPKNIPLVLALVVPAQLLNVYVPKYETGGRFWPIVHNSTIFSLLLMQAIGIGIFGLKKLPLASVLILPLPVLTLLFNDYCRKRFLPIFHAYPAESLIKKDRAEQNDPAMGEFFHELVIAYRDPTLMPIQHSLNSNEHSTPLLYSS